MCDLKCQYIINKKYKKYIVERNKKIVNIQIVE